jgi:hypothetical protein
MQTDGSGGACDTPGVDHKCAKCLVGSPGILTGLRNPRTIWSRAVPNNQSLSHLHDKGSLSTLWNPRIRYRVHGTTPPPPPDPSLSQINPVHTSLPDLSVLILLFELCLDISDVPAKVLFAFFMSAYLRRALALPISFLYLIILINIWSRRRSTNY